MGTLEANLLSGSMPRQQPTWDDAESTKKSLTTPYCGGEGSNSQGDEYAKLGGGLKRWRVTKNMGGYWTNTWMNGDEARGSQTQTMRRWRNVPVSSKYFWVKSIQRTFAMRYSPLSKTTATTCNRTPPLVPRAFTGKRPSKNSTI